MHPLLESLTRLRPLAADRPLNTPERHAANDFYGHAHVLKTHAGLPTTQPLDAVIEHSFAMNPDYVWDQDMQSGLAGFVVFSAQRRDVLRRLSGRPVEAVGPIIHYARPLASAQEMEDCRRMHGPMLLAFPVHSTHHVHMEFNVPRFCDNLARLGREHATVLVCLGWKDVLRGMAELYAARGFVVVTAGHMFDPAFLPRLKTIIQLAHMTVSTNFSTHVGYCIHEKRPHLLVEEEFHCVTATREDHRRDAACIDEIRREIHTDKYRWMLDPFRVWSPEITPAQAEVVRVAFGVDDLKTPQELREALTSFSGAGEKPGAHAGSPLAMHAGRTP